MIRGERIVGLNESFDNSSPQLVGMTQLGHLSNAHSNSDHIKSTKSSFNSKITTLSTFSILIYGNIYCLLGPNVVRIYVCGSLEIKIFMSL